MIELSTTQRDKLEALVSQQQTARSVSTLILVKAQETAEELIGLAEKQTADYIQTILDGHDVEEGAEYRYEKGELIYVDRPALSGQAEDVANGGGEDGIAS